MACKGFALLSESQENVSEIIDQECLSIIISCLRQKEIDLETLKEITKIFINLILWRQCDLKLTETVCCLCDIGLMVNDRDINVLAMFCLNALSENQRTHEHINRATIKDLVQGEGPQQETSIFNRVNYLLRHLEEEADRDLTDRERELDDLLLMLISSFYLNLSRNPDNLERLVELKVFELLQKMTPLLAQNESSLTYVNTIFQKIL